MSVQSMVLIAVDWYGAEVTPLHFSHSSVLVLVTWIVAMVVITPYFVIYKLVEYPMKVAWDRRWNKAFGESSSRANYPLALYVVFLYFHIATGHALLHHRYQPQVTIIPGEKSVNAEHWKRSKRNRNVLKMTIAVVVGFVLCWVPWSTLEAICSLTWINAFCRTL